jgi:hypothetical protein
VKPENNGNAKLSCCDSDCAMISPVRLAAPHCSPARHITSRRYTHLAVVRLRRLVYSAAFLPALRHCAAIVAAVAQLPRLLRILVLRLLGYAADGVGELAQLL